MAKIKIVKTKDTLIVNDRIYMVGFKDMYIPKDFKITKRD